jgi:carbamoyltransferase
MWTLGINAAFHDSAAALVHDGKVVGAAEEERFTGIKHGKRPVPFSAYELPYHAVDYCLAEAGIELSDLDHVAYSYDPRIRGVGKNGHDTLTLPLQPSAHAVQPGMESVWDPLFLCYIVNAPRQLRDGAPHHLQRRFRSASKDAGYAWHFVDHHVAHAASAYLASPFEHAAVMTLDGRGERATTSYAVGEGGAMRRLGQVAMPHSLGMVYEELTSYLGFLRSSDEYKVMALASYGKPQYADEFREMIQVGPSGDYTVRWFRFEDRFGPARRRGEPLAPKHFDLASSLQLVMEETVAELASWLRREAGTENLCMAGGVALNCVMNGRLLRKGIFSDIWVQPAAGDAGTALGAALWVDQEQRREANGSRYRMQHAYLGPQFDDTVIEKLLRTWKVPYRRSDEIARETASLLEEENIIGWFQGRMEFGPRALGARSILASPRQASMQQKLNAIKDREDFRPVAPIVLEEEASAWFSDARASPFMLFVFDVLPGQASRIPAVTHVDGTARVQTLRRDQNELLYDVIAEFGKRTGIPIVINTSFNIQSKPIVCTPRHAVEAFWTSPLDALVIGSFIVEKEARP